MSPIDRRTAVATLARAVCGLAGCLDGDGAAGDERGAGGPSATTEPATGTPTPAPALAERDPRGLLPEADNGWEFVDTDQYAWTTLGATDGVRGVYRSPNEVAYHA